MSMSSAYEHMFKSEKDFAVHNMALKTINHILKDDSMKVDDKFDEIVLIMEEAVRSLNKVK